jgi:hypothetical protein
VLLEHAIRSLIVDVIRYCQRYMASAKVLSAQIVVYCGFERSGCWVMHVGHSLVTLNEDTARRLFWHQVESGTGSTGVGIAFLGTYFMAMGFYPRASSAAPKIVLATGNGQIAPRGTWFSIYFRPEQNRW